MKSAGMIYGKPQIQGYIIPRGNDGFSPIITVSAIAGGNRITIQDIKGEKYLDVLNGAVGPAGAAGEKGDPGEKGDTGERGPAGPQGDAYVLTKADKEEIAAIVLADMPQGADVPAYDGSFSKGAM